MSSPHRLRNLGRRRNASGRAIGQSDLERVLRASLADNARRAPSGEALAERIIAEADHPLRLHGGARTRRWHTWSLPLIAAGSVAAVVAAVAGAAQLHRTSAHPAVPHLTTAGPPPIASSAPAPPVGSTQPLPTGPSSPSSTVTPPPTASQLPSVTAPVAVSGPVPRLFRVTDLTFAGVDEGWALGTGQCLRDPQQRCSALLRTADGGANWVSVPIPPAAVAAAAVCAEACVQHVRFANSRVGYAFGPDALFMTTDGAQSWDRLSGGADSLEVADGTAVRVTGRRLLVSAVGSTSWKAAPTLDGVAVDEMARAERWAFARAGATLYASEDGGVTWMSRSDPCGSTSTGRMAFLRLVAAADGSVITLCAGPTGDVLLTSSDGGVTFGKPALTTFGDPAPLLAAADRTTLFSAGTGLNRSTNGGLTWDRVAGDKTSGSAQFLGFETPATGRWVAGDGSTIWTTTDGGQTWSPRTFG